MIGEYIIQVRFQRRFPVRRKKVEGVLESKENFLLVFPVTLLQHVHMIQDRLEGDDFSMLEQP